MTNEEAMIMSEYDMAYGPKNPRPRSFRVLEMAGYEELKPVTRQVIEEVLNVICSCGKDIVKMSRQDVLNGKMAYCRKCDPARPKLVAVPDDKIEDNKAQPKPPHRYKQATEKQLAFISSLVSQAHANYALTDEEWDYVYSQLAKDFNFKTYQASLVITLLKQKLGLR